ncbi:MAG TPA: methyltransferase domain-containing protein, partial [Planctomycetaceae bacterium]|nr:methyltransferase domain-containing protein [Planctomycetaceae bacterium]
MARRMRNGRLMVITAVGFTLAWWPASLAAGAETPEAAAREILEASGVRGGLIVHLGCGDGRLTAALAASGPYVVQGLDADPAHVEAGRRHIRSQGLYGRASVARLAAARLPYVDNLVNLIVVERPGGVSTDELLRVLCPGGVALIQQQGQWARREKPWPATIDQWTHFLHDASNNAVADDSVVGPPRRLQWVGGPRYQRSHDHLASVSALVSSGGRIFYIVDEGPIAAVVLAPQWRLVSRDAFSGVVLWKRPIQRWDWHLRGFRSGPSDIARRLVAAGDRVYVPLGLGQPLCALDAASGRTVATYQGTEGTLEVIFSDGVLFVVAGDPGAMARQRRRGERPGLAEVRPQRPPYVDNPPPKRIVALEAATGRLLWERRDADTSELMPTTLATSGGRVFFQNPDYVICLDAASGKQLWRAERPTSRSRPAWSAPTLVVYGDVVLSADRAVSQKKSPDRSERQVEWIVTSAGGQAPVGELVAFSADTGRRLWSAPCRECYNAPVDVLVADGLVWTGNLVRARDPGVTEGRDPKTGEVKRTRPKDQQFFNPGMGHQRCYRNKATNRYLVLGRSGVEFIDLATGVPVPHHWTRGTCQYGVMPCNGLLYVPPHTCACFIRSKLTGFNCFSGGPSAQGREPKAKSRLERGPVYDELGTVDPQPATRNPRPATDWPTFRHDPARSGATPSAVPASVDVAWKERLGGRLSSVVVADGKLLVAQVHAHTVHALDAENGQPLWQFTAGGRVDSPPTFWQGRVFFGCADGWVYCLRASDGALAWRFRAAPDEQRIIACDQLESLWPVHGSVLVHEGVVYCAAGRSSYLDGGIRLCRLEATTGQLLSETVIDDRDPETGYQRRDVVQGTNMPGALPDVLSCDGTSVFMRHRRFDLEGRPQPPDVPHLFSAAGFLDDTWWHRAYWMIGTLMGTNYGGWPRAGNRLPAGRLLVVGPSGVYGFGRNQYVHHGAHVGIDGATVFHYNPTRDAQRRHTWYQAFATEWPRDEEAANRAARRGARRAPAKQYRWTRKLPVWARAMVLAGDTLWVAGPPDVLSSDDPAGTWEGRHGGVLCALSTDDGKILSRQRLPSPPVFDGLIAAAGRLYLATMDGQVCCLSGSKP